MAAYCAKSGIDCEIFVPLGNGTLFIGIVKALEELFESDVIKKIPNIIAVQSEHCDPFAKAVITKENIKLG